MADRIRDEDVAAVREKSNIADVIGEHVQLRNAGGGNLKGLCPFHDEKSPSFSVSPTRGLFYCFGCGAGGDVIRFLERIEHLSFTEAVQRLAAQAGVELRMVDGGTSGSRNAGQRARLIEAHALAAAFYAEQLRSPDAHAAREFLNQRGFDATVAERFGCGYAPSGWDALTKYLLSRGFSTGELTLAGLSKEGGRSGHIDRFHRRLLWPIKDVSGDVVGFGARRIHDDDRIEAKYLNTPETPIYKKSLLLYGMDVAKKEIAKLHEVVVVEGYTDVMACHLAGVGTAVATCGTAFGSEHISVMRRLLMDSDTFTGKVIFTFDGDAAGMKAAERAFADEQRFMAQTFVAIEPTGKDPCELRQAGGDDAVRSLVAARVPLVEFVLRATVGRFDLDSAEGRVAALDKTVPLVATIKDHALRDEYARRLAGLVGLDDPMRVVQRVRGMVRSTAGRDGSSAASGPTGPSGLSVTRPAAAGQQTVSPRLAEQEREVLKAALQLPDIAGKAFDELGTGAFLVAVHQVLAAAIAASGGASGQVAGATWYERIAQHLSEGSEARALLAGLGVEALRAQAGREQQHAEAMVAFLAEQVVSREIAQLKSKVQRMDTAGADEQGRVFAQLMQLEQRRRDLKARAIGGEQ